MQIVVARIMSGGGMTIGSMKFAISLTFNQYVKMLLLKPELQPATIHIFTPFCFGNSLTTYATGKHFTTRILSGSINTANSTGTFPIHIPFANTSFSWLPCFTSLSHPLHTVMLFELPLIIIPLSSNNILSVKQCNL